MKRVGILTYHSANNYGTCLQAYALQEAIEKAGGSAEIIRFQGEKLAVPPVGRQGLMARLIDMIVKTGAKVVKGIAQPAFESFRRDYFHYSKAVDSKTISDANDVYDLFVSGSDQVWNYHIAGDLGVYLQRFVNDPGKRGSYAASFGITELSAEWEQEYREALEGFRYLSVRETEGADLIRELTGREATVVVDPTQLIDATEWDKVMKPVRTPKQYIFVYQLGLSSRLLAFARALSRETGLPLVFTPFPVGQLVPGRYHPAISPAQWLYLMRHADYVVTNSFHGTAFSIGFQKNFFSEVSANLSALSSRIVGMLDRYGLKNRLIDGNLPPDLSAIDYEKVLPQYLEDRQQSLAFLTDMLKG